MEHLSEVVKILEAALRHDPRKAADYASLLVSKLEDEKQGRQANAIRTVLAKTPAPTFASTGVATAPPRDQDSQLDTVDVLNPDRAPEEIVLHPYVAGTVQDFLMAVRSHERWLAEGIATASRLLIYGPPGTGKTSIARKIAYDLGLPLITTRSDTLVSSLLGQTSRNIRQVFEFADRNPCVLFLDEFDALGKDRTDSREIGELQRVVIALLQNIDAMSPSTVLIAATNHESLLDPAVWRRFENTLKVDLPNPVERQEIWKQKLGRFAPSPKDLEVLVRFSEGLSGAAIQTAAFDMARTTMLEGHEQIVLTSAMRRLARIKWYDRYHVFDSVQTEILALRQWAPTVFSIRALAELFGVSARQVSNAIKGEALNGTGTSDSFTSEPTPGSTA
ncbi:AAA family ATPase [Arthrobacter sp. zg-Y750]|uniref:AAA family ATPase n=1 Tax=Arthrobacter sp. zg-Y750 TaxID=2894189 RepID=UPI001E561F82|nr:ATP-binding protein [Arthrobacter sp. zg-Y750]MCC9178537.1 ATP-binding protein [Arthrobacter sp. zg-Y750]